MEEINLYRSVLSVICLRLQRWSEGILITVTVLPSFLKKFAPSSVLRHWFHFFQLWVYSRRKSSASRLLFWVLKGGEEGRQKGTRDENSWFEIKAV